MKLILLFFIIAFNIYASSQETVVLKKERYLRLLERIQLEIDELHEDIKGYERVYDIASRGVEEHLNTLEFLFSFEEEDFSEEDEAKVCESYFKSIEALNYTEIALLRIQKDNTNNLYQKLKKYNQDISLCDSDNKFNLVEESFPIEHSLNYLILNRKSFYIRYSRAAEYSKIIHAYYIEFYKDFRDIFDHLKRRGDFLSGNSK